MSAQSPQISPLSPAQSALLILRQDIGWICLFVLLALAVRVDFQWANNFVVDADEAIVGLMAKHILEGRTFPVFYYGQHYMGSFEAIVAAIYRFLFGGSSVSLKAVPISFSIVFVVLTYLAGHFAGGKYTARLAAFLCAIPAAPLVVWSAKARGGFIEIICLGAISFLLTHRVLNKPYNYRRTALFWIGVVVGLGWWINNQVVFFMAPIGLVLIHFFLTQSRFETKRIAELSKGFLSGMSGFLIGGAPFWLYNLKYEFASFSQLSGPGTTSFTENLGGFFSIALPILLGGKRFWETESIFTGSGSLALGVFITIIAGTLWFRRREVLALLTFRSAAIGIQELCLLLIISCALIFCASSFGYLYTAPRYLLPLYVGIFPLFAYVIAKSWSLNRVLSMFLLFGILSLHLSSCYLGGRALPGEPFVFRDQRVSKDHSELIRWLSANKIEWIRTNYWIGYRLAFETDEQTKFVIFREPHEQRVQEYRDKAKQISPFDFPYVLTSAQADVMRRALGVSGVEFEEQRLSNYVVLYNLNRPDLEQAELIELSSVGAQAKASHGDSLAHFAIDGDDQTRWGSGLPRNPKMTFKINLPEPRRITAIRISMGQWCHDVADDLEIVAKNKRGRRFTVMSNRDYQALRFMYGEPCDFQIDLKPVRAKQIRINHMGVHPTLDWSLAEVHLLSGKSH